MYNPDTTDLMGMKPFKADVGKKARSFLALIARRFDLRSRNVTYLSQLLAKSLADTMFS